MTSLSKVVTSCPLASKTRKTTRPLDGRLKPIPVMGLKGFGVMRIDSCTDGMFPESRGNFSSLRLATGIVASPEAGMTG